MTVVQIIEEVIQDGRRLGRHIEHHPDSKNFQAEEAVALKSVDHGGHNLPFDQGQVGSCTGNAATAALLCDPNFAGVIYHEAFALQLYEDATKVDTIAGTYPPDDTGSSGLAVCKVLKTRGLIKSYGWTFSLNSALKALVLRPLIVGIPWYDSFDAPDSNGIVRVSPNAQVRGGHELCVKSLDIERQMVGLWQSWGSNWGLNGQFWMPWNDFETCLHNQGDVKVLIR